MPASLKKNPFFRSFAQIALWCYCIYSLLLFWNISGNQLLLWQPMSLPIVSSWFLCFWDTAVSCSCRQNCWRGSFSPADHGKTQNLVVILWHCCKEIQKRFDKKCICYYRFPHGTWLTAEKRIVCMCSEIHLASFNNCVRDYVSFFQLLPWNIER